MMSEETADRYQRMTPSERLKLTLEMIRENTPYLLQGPPEVVKRRFELIRRQNDERNQRMLEGIARTRDTDEPLIVIVDETGANNVNSQHASVEHSPTIRGIGSSGKEDQGV